MSIPLIHDLDEMHRELLSMCAKVKAVVHEAVAELTCPDVESSRAICRREEEIDEQDVRLEGACLRLIALHQPVATDLRRIAAILKISVELERIADVGVNISERAEALIQHPAVHIPDNLSTLATRALDMLDRSIICYVNLDCAAAAEICREDDEVDDLNRQVIDELTTIMQQSPELVPAAMHLFSVSRHLERVADHATNIAEDVIYLVEGEIIRHQVKRCQVRQLA